MSHIDALIKELCPQGVESRELGEIGAIFGGLTGKSKADFVNGNGRFVTYVNVYNNASTDLYANHFVQINSGERQRTLQRGDILFTGSSETPEDVAMSSVITADVEEPVYLNSFCIGYRLHNPALLDPDYAKHLFRSAELRKRLVRTASGVTRFNVSKNRLARVNIPIPPIKVQVEIARVLDEYRALELDLEDALGVELAARRRQYAHYRDAVFAFGDDIPTMPMGDLGEFIRGRRFVKTDAVDEGIPAIHYGEIYTHYGTSAREVITHLRTDITTALRYAEPGDVVIVDVGETVEDVGKAVAWLGDRGCGDSRPQLCLPPLAEPFVHLVLPSDRCLPTSEGQERGQDEGQDALDAWHREDRHPSSSTRGAAASCRDSGRLQHASERP